MEIDSTPNARLERNMSDADIAELQESPWDKLVDFKLNLNPLQVYCQKSLKSLQVQGAKLKQMSTDVENKADLKAFNDLHSDHHSHKEGTELFKSKSDTRIKRLEDMMGQLVIWKKDFSLQYDEQLASAKQTENALLLRVAQLEAKSEKYERTIKEVNELLQKDIVSGYEELKKAIDDLLHRQETDEALFEIIKNQGTKVNDQMELLQKSLIRQKDRVGMEEFNKHLEDYTKLTEELHKVKLALPTKVDANQLAKELELVRDSVRPPPPAPPPAVDSNASKEELASAFNELHQHVSALGESVTSIASDVGGKVGRAEYSADRSDDIEKRTAVEEGLKNVLNSLDEGHLMTSEEWEEWHTCVTTNAENTSNVANLKDTVQNISLQMNHQESELLTLTNDTKKTTQDVKAAGTDAKSAKYQASELEETVAELKSMMAQKVSQKDIADLVASREPPKQIKDDGNMPADVKDVINDLSDHVSQLLDFRRVTLDSMEKKAQLDDVKTLQRKVGALISEMAAIGERPSGQALAVEVVRPVELKGFARQDDMSKAVEMMQDILDRSNQDLARDLEGLQREMEELKESSKKAVDQSKSLMDTAVAKMDKKLGDKADKSTLDKYKTGLEQKIMTAIEEGGGSRPTVLPAPVVGEAGPGGDKAIQTVHNALQQTINQVNALSNRVSMMQDNIQSAATMVELRSTEEELRDLKEELTKAVSEAQRTADAKVDQKDLNKLMDNKLKGFRPPPSHAVSPTPQPTQPVADVGGNRFMAELDEFRHKISKEVATFEGGLEMERRRLAGMEDSLTKLQDAVARKVSRSQVQDEFEKLQQLCVKLSEEAARLNKVKAEAKDLARFQKAMSELAGLQVADGQAILAGRPAEAWRCLSCDRSPLRLQDEAASTVPHNSLRPTPSPEPMQHGYSSGGGGATAMKGAQPKKSQIRTSQKGDAFGPGGVQSPVLMPQVPDGMHGNVFVPTATKPPPNFHGARRDLVGESDVKTIGGRYPGDLPPVTSKTKSPSPRVISP
mmetsp:Transcript_14035/g.17014  ORF Transcript_14035/g.17014 Transcript_14035/m.17014 type:complete len:1017 (+) Transcript_14035:163-3213(+)|eukprot:CAMPEP_0197851462 /NCGR_PEP_ID=MMETSP1438-20131217/18139_1 /TAXON_ID=1461541 /ORGANISM="Pterosperma sp., Strain CCMP1384" /LENGTH=1016 /DNA_ID=CAMNT_0043465071 /DNA_START=157 /DNA_END=3207 /DNA_ORIENTATION=-